MDKISSGMHLPIRPVRELRYIVEQTFFKKKDKHPSFERDIVAECIVNRSVVTWNVQ